MTQYCWVAWGGHVHVGGHVDVGGHAHVDVGVLHGGRQTVHETVHHHDVVEKIVEVPTYVDRIQEKIIEIEKPVI